LSGLNGGGAATAVPP